MGAKGVEEIGKEGVNLCLSPEDRQKEAGPNKCVEEKGSKVKGYWPVCPGKDSKNTWCDGSETECQGDDKDKGNCACNLGRFFCATQSNPCTDTYAVHNKTESPTKIPTDSPTRTPTRSPTWKPTFQ